MEVSPSVKAMVISAKQYQHRGNSTNLSNLLRQLDILISITGHGAFNPSDFCPKDMLLVDCIMYIADFLNNPDVNLSLRNKCIQLLGNLSHDEELGRCLHETFDLSPVLTSLVVSHQLDTTDPLVLQCLEILHRITYGQCMSSRKHSYIMSLCTYLIQHVQTTENNLTTACLGLLVNLCRNNPLIQTHIKNRDHVKTFYKKLVQFLNGSTPHVVVYAQSILSNLLLEDNTAQQLFTVQNINQTFEYVFNLLVKGQAGRLRAHTVDLLVDMIKSTRVREALSCFDHIERSIQRVLSLVQTLKEKSSVKIFELLVEFCALPRLRSIISRCLFPATRSSAGDESDDGDFFTIVMNSACVNSGNVRSAILALKLLKNVIQEVTATNRDLLTPEKLNVLLAKLKTNVTIVAGDHIKLRCQAVTSTLDLLQVLLAADGNHGSIQYSFDAAVCCQILEYQYTHNTMGAVKYDSAFMLDNQDDWSEEGVSLALHVVAVMGEMKRTGDEMQQLIHDTLLDERFAPFLAFGLTSTNPLIVQRGIHLLSMASTLQSFPHVRLAELMAANILSKTASFDAHQAGPRCATRDQPIKRQCLADITSQMTNLDQSFPVKRRSGNDKKLDETDKAIENLILSFKSGIELKDVKVTEIIDVYEHKLQTLQTRFDDMESLLNAKMLATAQADRLIAHHSSHMAQADAEINQMRGLLRVAEKKCEESNETINDVLSKRSELQQNLANEIQRFEALTEEMQELQSTHNEQTQELKSVNQSLCSLREEHNGLTNIHDMLTKHHDSLKQQHDVLRQQFTDVQEEKKTIGKQLKENTTKLQEHAKALKSLKLQHEETKRERDDFEEITEKLRSDLSKADAGRKKLENQIASLELVIQDKDKTQNSLKEELSKHAQIAALIHNLSSGNVPPHFDTSAISK